MSGSVNKGASQALHVLRGRNARWPLLIYGLIDPRTATLFYIGKTHRRREFRLAEQVRESRDGCARPRHQQIREILPEGHEPFIFVLRRLQPEEDWRAAEIFEIQRWRNTTQELLTLMHPPQTKKSRPVEIRFVALTN